jgi:hypothetical protein
MDDEASEEKVGICGLSKSGGWGFLVRDSTGVVFGAGAGRIQYAQDALQIGAEVCSQALKIIQTWASQVYKLSQIPSF